MKSQNVFFEYRGKRISHREAQVLHCCANSMTVCQAANALFVAMGTIRKHHDNIRNRYDLKGYHALNEFARDFCEEQDKNT